jgi:hypothetical protein
LENLLFLRAGFFVWQGAEKGDIIKKVKPIATCRAYKLLFIIFTISKPIEWISN